MPHKSYKIGNYEQTIRYEDEKILDATCTCRWGTINVDNFQKGGKICKHLTKLLADLNEEKDGKQC